MTLQPHQSASPTTDVPLPYRPVHEVSNTPTRHGSGLGCESSEVRGGRIPYLHRMLLHACVQFKKRSMHASERHLAPVCGVHRGWACTYPTCTRMQIQFQSALGRCAHAMCGGVRAYSSWIMHKHAHMHSCTHTNSVTVHICNNNQHPSINQSTCSAQVYR